MHSSIPMPSRTTILQAVHVYEGAVAAAYEAKGREMFLPLYEDEFSRLVETIVGFWKSIYAKGSRPYVQFKEMVLVPYTSGDVAKARAGFAYIIEEEAELYVAEPHLYAEGLVEQELEDIAWMFFKNYVLDVVKASGRRS